MPTVVDVEIKESNQGWDSFELSFSSSLFYFFVSVSVGLLLIFRKESFGYDIDVVNGESRCQAPVFVWNFPRCESHGSSRKGSAAVLSFFLHPGASIQNVCIIAEWPRGLVYSE